MVARRTTPGIVGDVDVGGEMEVKCFSKVSSGLAIFRGLCDGKIQASRPVPSNHPMVELWSLWAGSCFSFL